MFWPLEPTLGRGKWDYGPDVTIISSFGSQRYVERSKLRVQWRRNYGPP